MKSKKSVALTRYAQSLSKGILSESIIVFAVFVAAVFVNQTNCVAQVDLMPSHEVEASVNSGDFYNNGEKPEIVWTEDIEVEGAEWIRLHFNFLVLAYDELGNTSSTLRITSLEDEAFQILDGKTAREWRNRSAYFNGNRVRLELIAWPNGRMNRVAVDSITAGEIPTPQESICDLNDDRILSSDARVARTDGGCTAWLFNDRKSCMLTAGHCAGSANTIFFNVPLSNSNGSYNFPGPDDQYAVDQTSKQSVNGGIGNDWSYFGCFANSNTGLSPFEAQGASFQLELPPAAGGSGQIRITGHGTTSSPVNPMWNGAQKTQVGPYVIFSLSELGYRTDTTGGNSGSPVIFNADDTAIGIHTHGGCGSGGSGNNWGTGSNNSGFQNALNNPQGICVGGISFNFPNGRPSFVDPSGGTTMRVVVLDEGDAPEPGTGLLHYDIGNGFQSVAMTEITPNVYDAVFPASPCGGVVDYYVSAENGSNELFTDPSNAPASFYSVLSAVDVQLSFADNFQTNMGWSVSGNATTGQWQRGVPAGGGDRGDPPTDGDGSGSCYVTGNAAGDSDVDGGSTVLTSPIMDATVNSGQNAVISYYRWFSNDAGGGAMEDIFEVEISNDGGTNWMELETVGPTGLEVSGGWFLKTFDISDFLPPTSQMRVRFTASDLINGSIVEAGVDGVEIQLVTCEPPTITPDSFNVIIGSVDSGGVPEITDSDDQYLVIDPQFLAFRYQTLFTVDATSSTQTPNAFEFNYESRVFNLVGTVDQKIELFNYDTGQFESVDSRQTTPTDSVVTVTPGGDLSRFVEAGTGSMQARIGLENSIPFWVFSTKNLYLPYKVRVDQIFWSVTP